MIRSRGIDHAAISVRDLERSLAFYTSVLGLRISEREYQKPGVEYFLDCGESLIGLIQGQPDGNEHLLEDAGIGGNHVSFRVPTSEFDAAVDELTRLGVTITFQKKRERSWSVYFLDPDGNKLEITAWPLEDGHATGPTQERR
ncbi:MAG: Glutathione transferase FosA [Candidatus Omnitrophica bacterium]|nr:Glutathione transferase FosA [Candidatus Omnitrophota bacterium]